MIWFASLLYMARAADVVFTPNLDVYYGTKINVDCSIETGMTITLLAPTAAKNMRFSLSDPSCLLEKNGNYHTITTRLSGCNNDIYINSTTLTIVNRITNILAVGRQPVRLESRVGCLFHQQEVSLGALIKEDIPVEIAPTVPPTPPPTLAPVGPADKPKPRGPDVDSPIAPEAGPTPAGPTPAGPTPGQPSPSVGSPSSPDAPVQPDDGLPAVTPGKDGPPDIQGVPTAAPTQPGGLPDAPATKPDGSPEGPTDQPGAPEVFPTKPDGSPEMATNSEGLPDVYPTKPDGSPDVYPTEADGSPFMPTKPDGTPDVYPTEPGASVPTKPTELPQVLPTKPDGSPDYPTKPDGSPDIRVTPGGTPGIYPTKPDETDIVLAGPDGPAVLPTKPDGTPDVVPTEAGQPEAGPTQPDGSPSVSTNNPLGDDIPETDDVPEDGLPPIGLDPRSGGRPLPTSPSDPGTNETTTDGLGPINLMPRGGYNPRCYGRKCREEPWRRLPMARGTGLFFAKLMLYTNSTYAKAYTYPPMLRTDDMIYAGVKLMGGPSGTALAITSCWASNVRHDIMEFPMQQAAHEVTLNLVNNGCPTDYPADLVQMISNGESAMATFQSAMFKFVDYDTAHIYCRVRVCPLGPCPKSCNGEDENLDIHNQLGMVDLGDGSGDDDEEGAEMPNFEMLVQADPYQAGSGPLLGATVYRDHPEELSDDRVIIEEEEEVLLSNFLNDSTMVQIILLALLGTACVTLILLGAFVIRKRRHQKLPE